MTASALAHTLFLIYLLGPWLYLPIFRRQAARIRAGIPNARVHLYQLTLAKQILIVALLLLLHSTGGVSAAGLGWVAPHSWVQTLAAGATIAAATFYFSTRIEPSAAAAAFAKVSRSPIGAMIPNSDRERLWIGWLSIGAGVMEEMLCRGFVFYYFASYLKVTNPALTVIASAVLFGLGHIYQGWKSAAGPAAVGVVLGSLYLYTGSLVLPIIVHAIGDYRLLWLLPKAGHPDEPSEDRLPTRL
jgi:membrane protease YdiL (CAAX protease family)